MTNGIFTVTATGHEVTPNICDEARVTVKARSVQSAVDSAHTIVSQWSKATGIPVTCDGYSVENVAGDPEAEFKEYTFSFHCI